MALTDKLRRLFNIDESEYFDEVDTEEVEVHNEPDPIPEMPRRKNVHRSEHRNEVREYAQSGRVVDIHTTAKLQVVLKKPERFEDAPSIADELMAKHTVVLNMECTSNDDASKLFSFLSGVVYANDGNMKKIANRIFIITPYNVDIMGDILDELENNGMFFV